MKKKCCKSLRFSRVKSRKTEADFDGGDISSDGGLLLVEQVDRKLGLTRRGAKRLDDTRQAGKVRHQSEAMLRQRVFGLPIPSQKSPVYLQKESSRDNDRLLVPAYEPFLRLDFASTGLWFRRLVFRLTLGDWGPRAHENEPLSIFVRTA